MRDADKVKVIEHVCVDALEFGADQEGSEGQCAVRNLPWPRRSS